MLPRGMKLVRLSLSLEGAVREIAADYEAGGDRRFDKVIDDYPAAVLLFASWELLGDEDAAVRTTYFLAQREDQLAGAVLLDLEPQRLRRQDLLDVGHPR